MTATNEMKNCSINEIVISKNGEQSVLLIALKNTFQTLPQYLRYLKREYEGAKDLQHENILKVYSLKELDGYGTCIETEWQDARTLAEYIEEGHSEEEKKEWLEMWRLRCNTCMKTVLCMEVLTWIISISQQKVITLSY